MAASVSFDPENSWCDWCARPVPPPVTILKETAQIALFTSLGRIHVFKKKLVVPVAQVSQGAE